MRFVAGLLCAALAGGHAFAQSAPTDIFEPIQGLYVDNPGSGITGPTSAAANWRIQFYGAPPGTLLNGFSRQIWGGYETDSGGTDPAAQITYNQYNDGGTTRLYQSGATLPCLVGSTVDEYDLQLVPDKVLQFSPLSILSHMYMQGTFKADGFAESDASCAMNVAVVTDAITLQDKTANQIFFYQVKLGSFSSTGQANPARPDHGWFYTGQNTTPGSGIAQQFGYDGSAADYGQATIQTDVEETLNFDILPQLLALIAGGGQYGMDTNPANWVVVEMYPQTTIFGHVGVAGYFSNLALIEQ